jgi:hypothetical protein
MAVTVYRSGEFTADVAHRLNRKTVILTTRDHPGGERRGETFGPSVLSYVPGCSHLTLLPAGPTPEDAFMEPLDAEPEVVLTLAQVVVVDVLENGLTPSAVEMAALVAGTIYGVSADGTSAAAYCAHCDGEVCFMDFGDSFPMIMQEMSKHAAVCPKWPVGDRAETNVPAAPSDESDGSAAPGLCPGSGQDIRIEWEEKPGVWVSSCGWCGHCLPIGSGEVIPDHTLEAEPADEASEIGEPGA